MKEKNDEDDKIANFMEISQINDRELAKEYLLSANWDESKAINAYFSRVDKNQIINNPSMNSNANYNNNIIPNNNISNNNNPINNDNNEGFLSRYIFSPIMSLFSSCYSNHESEAEDDINLFRFLPNKTKDFAKFITFSDGGKISLSNFLFSYTSFSSEKYLKYNTLWPIII